MPRCRFLVDRQVDGIEPQTFSAGEVYDLPRASVDRWVRRGVAVEVPDEPAVTSQPKSAKKGKRNAGPGDD